MIGHFPRQSVDLAGDHRMAGERIVRRRLRANVFVIACALIHALKDIGSRVRLEALGAGAMLAFAAVFAGGARAAKLTSTQRTKIEEPRPADVPSDEVLEAQGAIIGKIELDVRQIFDEHDARENSGLYHLADQLHVRTKQSTIRAQLLFHSGDRYQARILAETERNLRALGYLYDAYVVPVKYADGKVTIRVITKDVWTLSPGVSFSRAGGANSSGVDFSDSNFLGLGKSLSVAHSSNVDRTSNGITYGDPNLLGSRWTLAAAYVDASDGAQRTFALAQPFYSLDSPWTSTVKAIQYDRTVSRYNLGDIVDQFKRDETYYEVSGGLSSGLIDGWVRRIYAGMRYDENVFAQVAGTSMPAAILPPNRTLSYPFIAAELVQDEFRKVGDQNQIGRTEDLYFGTRLYAEIGYSGMSFGANQNDLLFTTSASKGYQLTELTQLFLAGTVNSRLQSGNIRNLFVDGTATYYWRWLPDDVLFVFLNGATTHALDPDSQLLIGGDTGLRGYPLRYESGTSRGLLTVEQRFYTDWYPFRLARFGAAIFSDVGRTWGSGVIGNSDPGTLEDVGCGMRFGNTRSGLGNVLHVDLAFPLKGERNVSKVQFLVQTKASY
jgi:outer membrane protein assembly factor BamA